MSDRLFKFDEIDDTPLSTLGVTVLRAEELLYRGKPKEQYVTSYTEEGYQVTKVYYQPLVLVLMISVVDYAAFKTTLKVLYSFCIDADEREMKSDNTLLAYVYATKGFEVRKVMIQDDKVTAEVTWELNYRKYFPPPAAPTNLNGTIG